MAEEQIIKLLEEIRDIQRENAANYKQALQNQEQAIAMQKRAMQRIRVGSFLVVFVLLFIVFVIVTYLLPFSSCLTRWVMRH